MDVTYDIIGVYEDGTVLAAPNETILAVKKTEANTGAGANTETYVQCLAYDNGEAYIQL